MQPKSIPHWQPLKNTPEQKYFKLDVSHPSSANTNKAFYNIMIFMQCVDDRRNKRSTIDSCSLALRNVWSVTNTHSTAQICLAPHETKYNAIFISRRPFCKQNLNRKQSVQQTKPQSFPHWS